MSFTCGGSTRSSPTGSAGPPASTSQCQPEGLPQGRQWQGSPSKDSPRGSPTERLPQQGLPERLPQLSHVNCLEKLPGSHPCPPGSTWPWTMLKSRPDSPEFVDDSQEMDEQREPCPETEVTKQSLATTSAR